MPCKKAYKAPEMDIFTLVPLEQIGNELIDEETGDTPTLYAVSNGWGPWV